MFDATKIILTMKKLNVNSQADRFNSEPLTEAINELLRDDPEFIEKIAERYSNLHLFVLELVIKHKIDLRDCWPIFGGFLDKADVFLFDATYDVEFLQKIDKAIKEGLSKEALKEVA